MAHPGGRPLKFKSVEDLQEKWEAFLLYCEDKQVPLTIGRLAVFLDVDSSTLVNYEEKEEFFPTIKGMKQYILADKEERLNIGKNVVGLIFDLKNNHKWSDKQEIDMNIKGEVSLSSLAKQAIDAQEEQEDEDNNDV